MKDKEIIKALECCPLDDIGGCRKIDALDLINRQKAEIARLNTRNNELNALNKTASIDAIKDFAERLKAKAPRIRFMDSVFSSVDTEDIDNLVKEMVGDIPKLEHNSLCETETYKVGE